MRPRTLTASAAGIALVPLLILLGAGLLILLVLRWQPVAPPRLSQHVTLYPEPKPLPAFHLVNQRGNPVTPADLRGHWSLLFFGYTHCPDVCPTTLGEMQQVIRRWGPSPPSPPRMVFVSIDPGRDTPQRLADYLGYFGESFLGLTGERAEIDRLAQSAGAFYQIHAPQAAGQAYRVDHSAGLTLVGPDAAIVALFPPPLEPSRLVKDLREIMRYHEDTH